MSENKSTDKTVYFLWIKLFMQGEIIIHVYIPVTIMVLRPSIRVLCLKSSSQESP